MDTKTQPNLYEIAYKAASSLDTRQQYWREQAKRIHWFKFPQVILDSTNPPFYRWYADGKVNITFNMFDRYLETQGDRRSLIWVSKMTNNERVWTLRQVYENVCRMCILLKNQGVRKGDRVIIYDPMIPQALFAVWACARIGAIHCVVFGGFSAKELSIRITDSQPKIIVTASCGFELNKIVNYVEILEEAILLSHFAEPKVLIYQRPNYEKKCSQKWVEYNLDELPFEDVQCEIMDSNDPLYILYTSGTSGAAKGIIRDQGGTGVVLEWAMNHIMGINSMDVFFCVSDIGWVVGHSFTIYGPLLRGAAAVLYEGKAMLPNVGVLWQIIEKYRVKGLYTSPSLLRGIRRQDNDGEWIRKYDISSLSCISMAGERCDIGTYEWVWDKVKVLINDNYWQTESGWIISCNYKNLYTFPVKAGSATRPVPGFNVQILNNGNNVLGRNELGKICIKLPMPPSFMLSLYNNDRVFIQRYLQEVPGYYSTGDGGYFDDDGYLNVMTRLDDIINTGGHRLSTGQIQEELLRHQKILQVAVIGKIDDLKGQVPVGLIVLKGGGCRVGIQKELVGLIRKQIGDFACFEHVIVVEKLPKTRSGKIVRNVLRRIVEGQEYRYSEIIEDLQVLEKIKKSVKQYGKGMGEGKKLVYRTDVDQLNTDALIEIQNENEEILDYVVKRMKE